MIGDNVETGLHMLDVALLGRFPLCGSDPCPHLQYELIHHHAYAAVWAASSAVTDIRGMRPANDQSYAALASLKAADLFTDCLLFLRAASVVSSSLDGFCSAIRAAALSA